METIEKSPLYQTYSDISCYNMARCCNSTAISKVSLRSNGQAMGVFRDLYAEQQYRERKVLTK